MKVTGGNYIEKTHCGYCGKDDESYIYGISFKELTINEYQQLIDRGFRRSGSFIYKPDVRRSCCPQYTIRLDVDKFKPTKDQRHTINRFSKFMNASSNNEKSKKNHGKDNSFNLVDTVNKGEESGDLVIKLDDATYTEEKFELFKKYQVHVHNDAEDENKPSGFKRFLCTNVFTDGDDVHGAKHQLYYYKGELIAIGVIDILPRCVSSVYLIWHPDYAKLTMGKVAAMHEIALTIKLDKPYYYLGFYIHNCIKMKYKGNFQPSFILDPRFTEFDKDGDDDYWIDSQQFFPKLDQQKYYSFVNKPEKILDEYESGNLHSIGMPGLLSVKQAEEIDLKKIPIMARGPQNKVFMVTTADLTSEYVDLISDMLLDLVTAVGSGPLHESLILDLT